MNGLHECYFHSKLNRHYMMGNYRMQGKGVTLDFIFGSGNFIVHTDRRQEFMHIEISQYLQHMYMTFLPDSKNGIHLYIKKKTLWP